MSRPASPPVPPWERPPWRRLHRWGARNPKWYYIGPASAWAVFIYVTCMADLREVPAAGWLEIPHFDKLVHGLYFAILSALIIRGWQREKMPPIGLHGFVLLMCATFGLTIEIQQSATGYRTFELADLAADAAGALIGQVLWHLAMIRWGKRTVNFPGLFKPGPAPAPRGPGETPSP